MKTPGIFTSTRRQVGAALAAAATALLVGCATGPTLTTEQQVQRRADAYWQARMAGQLDKAYALSTPSYRKVRTLEQFRSKFGGGASFVSAEVLDVRCATDRCTVKMKLGVQPALAGIRMGIVPNYIDEVWLLEDRQWWHYQDL